jgi:hypothetical protein
MRLFRLIVDGVALPYKITKNTVVPATNIKRYSIASWRAKISLRVITLVSQRCCEKTA